MKAKKAYFVDAETEDLFELSAYKRTKLEEIYPNWMDMNCENHPSEMNGIYTFFINHGVLIGSKKNRNIFVGLISE